MENNNNDRKMFITVLSIATLIVSILGATFAYFSAQTNSAPNAVGAGAAEAPELSILGAYVEQRMNMIPSTENIATYAAFVEVQDDKGFCLDDNGNEVCNIYSFSIYNNSDVIQTVNIALTTTYLNRFTNLSYKVYSNDNYGEAVDATTSAALFAVHDISITHSAGGKKVPALNGTDNIDSNVTIGLGRGNDVISYKIIIWLNETNTNQNAEAGGSWSGTINVTTGTGTGITGVIEF